MKTLNNYIFDALIKKDTKLINPIEEEIYNHFKIIKPEYIDKCDNYLKELKDTIEEWIETYDIKNVDGPYINGDNYYGEDPNVEKLLNFIKNNYNNIFDDYKEIDKIEVNKLTNNFDDWKEPNKIDPDFLSYPQKNKRPYLLGTSKRISIHLTDITSSAIIIYLVKNKL